ncbi:MAG TPA: DUF2249 domain-containing protein [Jatrophihabitans sp.]|nr:DUF2249 domain-containing protein [Jatrophihabitans sp.]
MGPRPGALDAGRAGTGVDTNGDCRTLVEGTPMNSSAPHEAEQVGPPDSTESTAHAPLTLSDEHALLIGEVTARVDATVHEIENGRWPTNELRELVNYLHLEVLRQIVDEEWLLFRTSRSTPEGLDRLRRDHLELRLTIDLLTHATMSRELSPTQIVATIDHLLTQLTDHMAAEERLLGAAGAEVPAVQTVGSQPHEWYDLTEGPVIDLDKLPGEQGADAALARLTRLRRGEKVELQASIDPGPLWQRLVRADPGGYGITYLENGPRRWRVQLVNRPDRWSPQPMA